MSRLGDLSDVVSQIESMGVTLDLYPQGKNQWTLHRIVVPKALRSEGTGTAALKAIVSEADREGVMVALTPSTDFGATSKARLIDFYKRFGFVENKGRNKDFSISEAMYRTPKASLGALPRTGRIPLATARRALKSLGRKATACRITPEALREGMEVEREHRDVTRGGVLKTAKIAAAHICEDQRYYPELKKLERKLKRGK